VTAGRDPGMITGLPDLTAVDFEALGVYDPGGAHARQQLELLEYLVSLGATADDLVEHRDGLAGLASVVAIRGGAPLTAAEAALRAGISEEKLLRVTRAAGFADPGHADRVIVQQLADLAADMAAAEALFGEDAVLQLLRVMGSAMARVADAMVSAFLVNVEPAVRAEDPVGFGVARANAQAAALVPTASAALDILLRQHIIASRRTILGDAVESGYETQPMCVGFVDLVGSSALALRLSTGELGGVLTEFENIASDSVTAMGGRVVKLIGDEVLYTAGDASSACTIALNLAAAFDQHPVIPQVRAGIAAGEVLLRDGDVFGPVVNLAARAVKLAAPGEVVTPTELAAAAGVKAQPLTGQLTDLAPDVELCRLDAT
jgi:class 3 adenylate cyclase